VSFELDSRGVLRLAAWRGIPWLLHGFTTRQTGDFGNGTPDDECLHRLGADGLKLRTVRQIHSNEVCLLDEEGPQDGSSRPEADALISGLAGHVLGVRTADCLPLLLVDRDRRAVAAVHAGWRGTQQRVAAHAVEKMRECFGSDPGALEAAIGPGINVCCFEVGKEVAGQFHPSLVVSPPHRAKTGRDIAAGSPAEPLAEPRPEGRPHVDLVEANREQLLEQGIPARSIWSAGRCTCCNADEYFSYRRAQDTARMLAFAGVKAV
jgi:purine-nucleoside/S-methyl-5'-thioadenosine phosphorylase / adenosine deaminase